MLIFQGLRKPNAQISGRTPVMPTNGLSGGNAIGLARLGVVDVDAEDAREQVGAVLAGISGSGGDGSAPSPVEMYR